MEYWSGWFDVWGESHHVFHAEGTETLLNHHFSSDIFAELMLIFSTTLHSLHSITRLQALQWPVCVCLSFWIAL